jgi:hypothetical protein
MMPGQGSNRAATQCATSLLHGPILIEYLAISQPPARKLQNRHGRCGTGKRRAAKVFGRFGEATERTRDARARKSAAQAKMTTVITNAV